MVSSAPKALPPYLEDGEIGEADKSNPSSNHKTYSILDNPLISNPSGSRRISAKARKVLAWTKKLAMREARQKVKDDRPRTENRDFRRPNRSRRFHPARRLSDSRSAHHGPRSGISLTDEEHDHDDENSNRPPPKALNDYPSPPRRRFQEGPQYAHPDDQPMYPSDQQYDQKSVYSEPRRSLQVDPQPHNLSDRQFDVRPVYPEARRSSYPPEASFPSRLPPSRHQYAPNLVPNYPPSHYHSNPPPPPPPNVQKQPIYEYEPAEHPSFSNLQPPPAISQPPTNPLEYNGHSHPPQISPLEAYYPPQVHHSPPVPQPVSSSHELRPENHPPYYASDPPEQRRQAFHPVTERPIPEPYPVHPSDSQPVVATRFVPNYPVPPVHYDYQRSPQPSTSSHRIETSQTDPYRTAPPYVHQPTPVKFEHNPYRNSTPHPHLEKDRHWRPEESTRPSTTDSYRTAPSHHQSTPVEFEPNPYQNNPAYSHPEKDRIWRREGGPSPTYSYRPAPSHVHQPSPIEFEHNPYQNNPAQSHPEKDRIWRREGGVSPTDSYQSALHQQHSLEFEPNPYQNNPAHSHPEKDRIWRSDEATRWEHESVRVDPYHQRERPPAFSRTEAPPLVPLAPSKNLHLYPSHENEDLAPRRSNPVVTKNTYEQESQWYPIDDDDYERQTKEAQEIMFRLISWGVTAEYLMSIGISESLVRTVYSK